MIKFGYLAAFNNVFSNVGYVLLGIMFIIVVKKRAYAHKYMRNKYPEIISVIIFLLRFYFLIVKRADKIIKFR